MELPHRCRIREPVDTRRHTYRSQLQPFGQPLTMAPLALSALSRHLLVGSWLGSPVLAALCGRRVIICIPLLKQERGVRGCSWVYVHPHTPAHTYKHLHTPGLGCLRSGGLSGVAHPSVCQSSGQRAIRQPHLRNLGRRKVGSRGDQSHGTSSLTQGEAMPATTTQVRSCSQKPNLDSTAGPNGDLL